MKQKVALALSSGGARGITHIGAIRELERQGFEINSISGTSMGALIGGIYAAQKLDEYEEWLCALSKRDVFNLIDFTFSSNGIIKADKVLQEIQKFIPDQKIEDLPIKYSAVATDINHKKEVVITKGSLFEAIRASISIPMVVTPLKKNDTLFVDGGVLNPMPVNRVARSKGDILIAVNVNSLIENTHPIKDTNQHWNYFENLTNGKLQKFKEKLSVLFPNNKNDHLGYFSLIGDTSVLMLSQISTLTLQLMPPDIIIEIPREVCGTFDFYKATELIDFGKNAARESINTYNN